MLDRYAAQFPDVACDKLDRTLHMLRQASLLIRKLDAYFMRQGLSQTRFFILIVLDRECDRQKLAIREIVEKLDVSKPVVTNTLKSLQQDGLIIMTEIQEDRRGKWVEMTAAGRCKLYEVLPGYYKIMQEDVQEDVGGGGT